MEDGKRRHVLIFHYYTKNLITILKLKTPVLQLLTKNALSGNMTFIHQYNQLICFMCQILWNQTKELLNISFVCIHNYYLIIHPPYNVLERDCTVQKTTINASSNIFKFNFCILETLSNIRLFVCLLLFSLFLLFTLLN